MTAPGFNSEMANTQSAMQFLKGSAEQSALTKETLESRQRTLAFASISCDTSTPRTKSQIARSLSRKRPVPQPASTAILNRRDETAFNAASYFDDCSAA